MLVYSQFCLILKKSIMAEVIQNSPGKGKNKARKSIHIDMTPMVDLGFLLITFFIMITTFQKENIMDLGLPAKSIHAPNNEIDVKNQLTFILGENNRVFYYQKQLKDLVATDLKEISLSGSEIPKLIASYKALAPKKENFTVIVKPSDKANYENFVDMLDHLAIGDNERYGITDMQPREKSVYEGRLH